MVSVRKITFKERLKLYFQRIGPLFLLKLVFPIVTILVYCAAVNGLKKTISREEMRSMILTMVLTSLFIYSLFFIDDILDLVYLFKKNIYVMPGKITKGYRTSIDKLQERTGGSYPTKRICFFSDKVKERRKSTGSVSYRAKAQTLDGKYTTSWVKAPKRVIKDYPVLIVIYQNTAITFIY